MSKELSDQIMNAQLKEEVARMARERSILGDYLLERMFQGYSDVRIKDMMDVCRHTAPRIHQDCGDELFRRHKEDVAGADKK